MSPERVQEAKNLPRVEELPDDPVLLRGMLEEGLKLFGKAQVRIDQLEKQLDQRLRGCTDAAARIGILTSS